MHEILAIFMALHTSHWQGLLIMNWEGVGLSSIGRGAGFGEWWGQEDVLSWMMIHGTKCRCNAKQTYIADACGMQFGGFQGFTWAHHSWKTIAIWLLLTWVYNYTIGCSPLQFMVSSHSFRPTMIPNTKTKNLRHWTPFNLLHVHSCHQACMHTLDPKLLRYGPPAFDPSETNTNRINRNCLNARQILS